MNDFNVGLMGKVTEGFDFIGEGGDYHYYPRMFCKRASFFKKKASIHGEISAMETYLG